MEHELEIEDDLKHKIALKSVGEDRDENRWFLKPNIVACLLQKLGEETIYTPSADVDEFETPSGERFFTMFLITEGRNPETADEYFGGVATRNPDATGAIVADSAELGARALELLKECVNEKVDSKAIQKAVVQREGRKYMRATMGMRNKAGQPAVPVDVARHISSFATSKIDGGKKKRTQKKKKQSKKIRKQTRRR